MKTILPHTLHRINKFGTLKLEDFKGLISDEEYDKCISTMNKRKFCWFPLVKDIFVNFLFQVLFEHLQLLFLCLVTVF